MRMDDEVDEVLRRWMRREEQLSADAIIDSVAGRLPTIPQRSRRATYVQRVVGLAAAAVVIVATLVGVAALASGVANVAGPPPSTSSDLGTPPPRFISAGMGALNPGIYTLGPQFPVRLTIDVPDGFFACVDDTMEQGVCADTTAPAGLTFVIVENLVADACLAEPVPADPPIGLTVDDLVGGLERLPGFTATPVESATVGGLPARALTVIAPTVGECGSTAGGHSWIVSPTRTNGVAQGERNELFILDVQGERLMIAIAYQPTTPLWAIEAMRDMVGTISFDP